MIASVKETVSAGKLKQIEAVVQEALNGGATPDEVLDSMSVAMDEVGEKFQKNEIYVPEMLIAAKTMQRGVGVLKPLMAGDAAGKYGKFIIGTVAGDLHDIGKNLVAIMVEAAGFEVIDLGIDCPKEKVIETIKAEGVKIVALSGVLTLAIDSMKDCISAIKAEGLNDVKVIIGGAPVSESAKEVTGADEWAYSPQKTVQVCKEWAKL